MIEKTYVNPQILESECDRCNAQPGEYCISKSGRVHRNFESIHIGRKDVYYARMRAEGKTPQAYVDGE